MGPVCISYGPGIAPDFVSASKSGVKILADYFFTNYFFHDQIFFFKKVLNWPKTDAKTYFLLRIFFGREIFTVKKIVREKNSYSYFFTPEYSPRQPRAVIRAVMREPRFTRLEAMCRFTYFIAAEQIFHVFLDQPFLKMLTFSLTSWRFKFFRFYITKFAKVGLTMKVEILEMKVSHGKFHFRLLCSKSYSCRLYFP